MYCTFAKSTNRASIRYFNLIKFYIQHYAAALIFYFYECRILLSRQTNKIDFFSFVFSIRVYFVIRTHGRKYARIKNDASVCKWNGDENPSIVLSVHLNKHRRDKHFLCDIHLLEFRGRDITKNKLASTT